MRYRIKGLIETKQGIKEFSREIEADNEGLARHKIYSFFGNVYRLPRRKIKVTEVSKM